MCWAGLQTEPTGGQANLGGRCEPRMPASPGSVDSSSCRLIHATDSRLPLGSPCLKHARKSAGFPPTGRSVANDSHPAESRRGHGQAANCLMAICRRPTPWGRSLTTSPWKTRRVSHTSPQKAISSKVRLILLYRLIQSNSGMDMNRDDLARPIDAQNARGEVVPFCDRRTSAGDGV